MMDTATTAAERLVHAAQRVDWTHVTDGLDVRDDQLVAYEQHGRVKANRDTMRAMQDFLAVLREFDIDMRPDHQ